MGVGSPPEEPGGQGHRQEEEPSEGVKSFLHRLVLWLSSLPHQEERSPREVLGSVAGRSSLAGQS